MKCSAGPRKIRWRCGVVEGRNSQRTAGEGGARSRSIPNLECAIDGDRTAGLLKNYRFRCQRLRRCASDVYTAGYRALGRSAECDVVRGVGVTDVNQISVDCRAAAGLAKAAGPRIGAAGGVGGAHTQIAVER